MRASLLLSAVCLLGCATEGPGSGRAAVSSPAPAAAAAAKGPLTPVPFHRVAIHDAFWSPWLEVNRTATVTACLDKCDETGRITNFARAGGLEEGPHQGLLFNDSDLYKILEGAAYTLHVHPDPALEARCDAIIDQIEAAQEEDGYLNTYVQLVDPSLRWRNIAHGHELYCAGHLIEAGIAYWQATGKRKLLDVAIRFADRIDADFGPGKRLDPPGHEELELALLKLARVVPADDAERYTELAGFFVEQRGRPEGRKLFGDYAQDHVPVREQREVTGHAVRAMYLYCGMADLAAATGDETLLGTLEDVWEDIVFRKMYLTGGIGSSAGNEGFTRPYDLPNDTAYAETCAAIGMVLWNQRMYLATGEARYAEILERALYNGALAGMGRTGDRFFYDNPLGSKGDHHRVPWFDCSCCPSNLVRFLPSLGERIYATRGNDELWVALYVGSETTVEMNGVPVKVRVETDYPWDGKVALHVDPQQPVEFSLNLRVPGWAGPDGVRLLRLGTDLYDAVDGGSGQSVTLGVTDEARDEGAFHTFRRTWSGGDRVELVIALRPRRVYADERVEADRGRVALMRGPLVYAAEEADNPAGVRNQVLAPAAELSAGLDQGLLGGVVKLRASGPLVVGRAGTQRLTEPDTPFTLVPYAFWDNRDPGEMVVWLPESPELAEVPGEGEVAEQGGVLLSASHCYGQDTVLALNDGELPSASDDHAIPRLTFWDHRGTTEWVQMRFDAPRTLSSARVYWFDDTGRGACRVPAAWHLEVETPDGWTPVQLTAGSTYGVAPDAFQAVRFDAIEATAARLVVELQGEVSGGILEWEVSGP